MEPVSVASGDGGVGYGANIGAFPTVEVNQSGVFASQDEKSTKDEPDRRHQAMAVTQRCNGGSTNSMHRSRLPDRPNIGHRCRTHVIRYWVGRSEPRVEVRPGLKFANVFARATRPRAG